MSVLRVSSALLLCHVVSLPPHLPAILSLLASKLTCFFDSDYAVKVFGYATFGTVYGTIICLSGIFTFTQSGLQALLHKTFEDDPEPINLGLATAGLVLGIALVMYVDIKGRAMQREKMLGKPPGSAGDDARRNGTLPPVSSPSRRGVVDDPERQSLLPPRPLRPVMSRDLSTVQERAEP